MANGLLMDHAGIHALLDAIRHLHGVEAVHIETVHVDEHHEGERVWEGDVEMFALIGHPLAMQAYAWSETGKDGRHRFFAVLGVPPIDSASSAVRGSIWADARALRESNH
jgi:hypothetical protein